MGTGLPTIGKALRPGPGSPGRSRQRSRGGGGRQGGLHPGQPLGLGGRRGPLGRSLLPAPSRVHGFQRRQAGDARQPLPAAASRRWPRRVPADEVLESYENPPPIVLPSEGFQVDLDADRLDDSIYQHLLYIRHFLWSLRSKPSASGGPAPPECPQVPGGRGRSSVGLGLVPLGPWPQSRGGLSFSRHITLGRWALSWFFFCPQGPHHASPEGHPEASRDPGRGAREASPEHPPPSSGAPRAQGPPGRPSGRVSRGGPQPGPPHGDASCLLTPPATPLEPTVPEWPEASSSCGRALLEGSRNGLGGPRGAAPEGEPPPVSCLHPSPSPASAWRVPQGLSPWGPGGTRGPQCHP